MATAVVSPLHQPNLEHRSEPDAPIHHSSMQKQNRLKHDASNSSVQVAVRIRPLLDMEVDRREFIQLFGSNNESEPYSLDKVKSKSFSDNSTATTQIPQSISTRLSSSTLDSIEQKSDAILSYPTLQIGEEESAHNFTFDHIFPLTTQQEDIYYKCVTPLVKSCLEGYNATVLAYGQTGSGKTHTILGDLNDQQDINEFEVSNPESPGFDIKRGEGVIPRALRDIFQGLEEEQIRAAKQSFAMETDIIENSPTGRQRSLSSPSATGQMPFEYSVKIQFVELYGETIRDLLDAGPVGRGRSESLRRHKSTGYFNSPVQKDESTKIVSIRDGKAGEGAEMIGAEKVEVGTVQEALNYLQKGLARRVVGKTAMNAHSSRSHAIFSVVVHQTKRGKLSGTGLGGDRTSKENMLVEMKTSKIHFVDLCGSERAKRAQTAGKRLKEGIDINKGLLVLGNVISALGKSATKAHVPYRDSKLTRLLKGSLGGNHKTLMIACVSSSPSNFNETVSTLRYANRAKNIQNHAKINVDPQHQVVQQLRGQVAALASELLRMLKKNNEDSEDHTPFSLDFLKDLVNGGDSPGWNDHDILIAKNSSLDSSDHPIRKIEKPLIVRPSTSPDFKRTLHRQVSWKLEVGKSLDSVEDDESSADDPQLTKNIQTYDFALGALKQSLLEKSFKVSKGQEDEFDIKNALLGDRRSKSLSPERRQQEVAPSVPSLSPPGLKNIRNIDELYNYLNDNTYLNEEGEIVDEDGTVMSEVFSSHVSKLDDVISQNEKLVREMESCHEMFEVSREENNENLVEIDKEIELSRKEKESLESAQNLFQNPYDSKGLVKALAVKEEIINDLKKERDELLALNERTNDNLQNIQELHSSIEIMKKQRDNLSRIGSRPNSGENRPRSAQNHDNTHQSISNVNGPTMISPPAPERKMQSNPIRKSRHYATDVDIMDKSSPESNAHRSLLWNLTDDATGGNSSGNVPPVLETSLDASRHTFVSQLETPGFGSNHDVESKPAPVYTRGQSALEIKNQIKNSNRSNSSRTATKRKLTRKQEIESDLMDYVPPLPRLLLTKNKNLSFPLLSPMPAPRSVYDVIEESVSSKSYTMTATNIYGGYKVDYHKEMEEQSVDCGAGFIVDTFRSIFGYNNPVLRQWDA